MRILIVEDDPELRELLESILSARYPTDAVGDLDEGHTFLESYRYDVILLDRNLMGEDIGLRLIAPAKEKNPFCGILVMSAYASVVDKIEGLNQGADDYIEKPFDIDELLARINALSRRFFPSSLQFGDITVDLIAKTVVRNGDSILLTKKEHDIFFTLVNRVGQIVSRDEIIQSAYLHPDSVASNTVDVMINNLRKKLGSDLIKTVKTRGYTIEHP